MDNKNRVIKAYLKKVQAEDLIELKGLIKIEIGIGSEEGEMKMELKNLMWDVLSHYVFLISLTNLLFLCLSI